MKLVQIKLSGFKSFGVPITIDVKGTLIGIVGPNGCGKSNIIDAVRWVLGESSAKELRGTAMQDVIFNGSATKSKVSRAAVELVFDNTAQVAQGMWNSYSEITLKRVLTRDGDSSYYINNQVVRRKDITELFLGTGAGARGYAIIEQGMISKIIEANKDELKGFLEEASGVSKYREKRKESLSKLQSTEENLTRLYDIQAKLNEQEQELNEQALITQRYNQLNEEIHLLRVSVLLAKVDKANTNKEKYAKELAAKTAALEQITAKLAEVSLEDIRNKKEDAQLQKNQMTTQVGEFKTRLAVLKERQEHGRELDQKLIADKESLELQAQNIIDSGEGYAEEIVNLEELCAQLQEKAKSYQAGLDQTHLSQYKKEYLERLSKLDELKQLAEKFNLELKLNLNSTNHKTAQLKNLKTKLVKMSQETVDNSFDFTKKYDLLKSQIQDLTKELELLGQGVSATSHNVTTMQASIDGLKQNINTKQNVLSGVKSKLSMLERLVESQTKSDNTTTHSYLKLWQSLEVKEGYELMVELALGDFFNALVLDKDALESNNFKNRQAFYLALNNTQVQVQDGRLSSYVTLNNDKLNSLYGVLNNYMVCDNLETAKSTLASIDDTNLVIITKDGHLVNKNYLILNAKAANSQNVLMHKKDLQKTLDEKKLLEQEINKLDLELQYLNSTIKTEQDKQSNQTQQLKTLEQKKQTLTIELTREEQIYIQALRYQEKLALEINALSGEEKQLNHELENLAKSNVEIEDKLSQNQEQIIELNIAHYQEIYENANLAHQKLLDEFNQNESSLKLHLQKIESIKSLIANNQVQLDNIKAKVASISQEQIQLQETSYDDEISQTQTELSKFTQELSVACEKLEQITSQITFLENQQQDYHTQKEGLMLQVSEINLQIKEIEVLTSTYEEELQLLEWSTDDQVKIDELKTQNAKSLEQRHSKLNEEVEALGLVNLKAIQDLDGIKLKQEELNIQLDDLVQSIEVLRGAISQIDGESKKLLESTYERVTLKFDEYFKLLFGGGSAKLMLLEEDILTSGLQIVASPLGKKNTSLYQLSGGEKALTAMSLIFAFFSLNPAPFCLLDEVDAPLDDANTQRFCDLLLQLSQKTQFVYISHNRLTMEMADQLIGITMQEKGISSVIGVNVQEVISNAQTTSEEEKAIYA